MHACMHRITLYHKGSLATYSIVMLTLCDAGVAIGFGVFAAVVIVAAVICAVVIVILGKRVYNR